MHIWTYFDDFQKLIEKSVHKFNEQSNDAFHHRLVKVHSVHSQVVAGVNYKIKLDLGKTGKKKGETVGDNEEVSDTKTVTANVFSQPWTNTEEFKFDWIWKGTFLPF